MSETTKTELAIIEPNNALSVFTKKSGMDPYMAKIKAEIDAFEADISTPKGRKEIASMAYIVSRSKTYLDGVGKKLSTEYKQIPLTIDASRKIICETLDKWRDNVRKPLSDWETAEENRTTIHRDCIASMANGGTSSLAGWMTIPLQAMKDQLDEIKATEMGDCWQEFAAEAATVKDAAITKLEAAIYQREAYDAQQAENERLRLEAEERAERDLKEAVEKFRQEREATIARDAAEKAKRETEEAEQEKRALADKERQEAQEAQAAAEQRAKEAEAKAKREKQEAIKAERQRVEDERLAIERQAKVREANRAHKNKINKQAKQGLVAGGLSDDAATLAITLISKGDVAHVSVRY
ncbi:MAG: hypothetical protein JKY34_05480 [Kordiimonadaceae bacterium]|nr:hypothetical protein [Kordiimonadaceae bacterium]